MHTGDLIASWKAEEQIAHVHGWDFSHVDGRVVEDALPWDYREQILHYLQPEMQILDIDTGGGEFLLSLHHPYRNTSATENYPPNIELCQKSIAAVGDRLPISGWKRKSPF